MISLPDLMHWIQVFSFNHEYLIYGVLYLLALIEGHIITIISGLFIRLDYLNPFSTACAIILGNLTGVALLYWAGYRWGEKFILLWGKYLNITTTSIKTAEKIFEKYHARILLGSKLTNGFGLAMVILFTAGMTRISFKKYMALNTIGEIVWTCILLFVGYSFGNLYITIDNIFGRIFLVVMFLVIVYVFIRISAHLRAKITRS